MAHLRIVLAAPRAALAGRTDVGLGIATRFGASIELLLDTLELADPVTARTRSLHEIIDRAAQIDVRGCGP